MSLRGDISDWVVSRIESQVPAFRSVNAIAAPEEFEIIARNPPGCAVIVTRSTNAGQDLALGTGEEYVYITVQIWLTAPRFRSDTGAGLDDADGIYELLDDLNTALRGQRPDSAYEPMRFMDSEVTDIADGRVTAAVDYQTAAVI